MALAIAVNGAAGRMGRRIIALAAEAADLRIAAAIERPDHALLGEDAGRAAGLLRPLGVPIAAAMPDGLRPDAAIDFSMPEAAVRFALACAARSIPLVIGTTGLQEADRRALAEASRSIPLLLAPNLALGVALLLRLARDAARVLGLDADVEIVETHHRAKRDAPSGTALAIARVVADSRGQDLERDLAFGRRGEAMAGRPRGEIAIHALRLADVVGEHAVTFGFGSERLEIRHEAHSRDVFARGAFAAARFVATAPPGLYGLEDLLAARNRQTVT